MYANKFSDGILYFLFIDSTTINKPIRIVISALLVAYTAALALANKWKQAAWIKPVLIGLVIVEHFKKDELPKDLKTLAFIEERRYGDTNITIYKKIYDKDEDSDLPGNI